MDPHLASPPLTKGSNSSQRPDHVKDPPTSRCQGCNRVNHQREDCRFKNHPDFNARGQWDGCLADRALRRWLKDEKDIKLIWGKRADGTPWGTVVGAHLARSSRHDVPTSEVGLAGMQSSSSIYGSVIFDLTFFNEITKSDNILKSIEANVIDSCIEVIIGLPDIRSHRHTFLLRQSRPHLPHSTSGYFASEYSPNNRPPGTKRF